MIKNIALIALAIIAAGAIAWSFSITDKALNHRPPVSPVTTPTPTAPPLTFVTPTAAPLPFVTPTAAPSPAFTPDPELLAFANAVLSQRPWLEARSTDAAIAPGAGPATTFIVSRAEPVVVKDGDGWKITFKSEPDGRMP